MTKKGVQADPNIDSRGLGCNRLNKAFSGSVWHHVNDQDVVAVPELLHWDCNLLPNDRVKHRILVLNYYGTIENMIAGHIRPEQKERYCGVIKKYAEKRETVKDRVVLEDKLSREAIAIVFQKSIQTIDRWLASGKLRSRSIGDVIALRVREQ